jgi:FAD/FMN-containing dehydrogenase
MLNTNPPGLDFAALRTRIDGVVSTPGDPNWDEARQAWNLAVDQRPAAVAIPEAADEVVSIVEFARERGLRVTAQGTGHNAAAYASLEDTILVKTSAIRGVEIDAEAQIARVGAGTLWIEVTQPASELGLAPLAGSSPDVGVVGYSLGGGMSWLVRKHGLGANHIVAVEIVTADGRLVRADAENEVDLFWAIRGGGGNFGIVTAMEIRLFPIAEVYAGMMLWPWERSAEVLKAWAEWTRSAPEEVSTSARVLKVPVLPGIPEFLAGRAFVVIDGAVIGDEAAGAEVLRPLTDLGPEMSTFAMIPSGLLSYIHMDPEGPTAAIGGHTMVDRVTDETIDALVEVAGPDADSPLLMVELRHLGGAAARASKGHGAIAVLPGEYAFFAAGIPETPEIAAAIRAHLVRTIDALEPWDAGTAYLNFQEEPTDVSRFYDEVSWARLRHVKAHVDPENRIYGNHPIA